VTTIRERLVDRLPMAERQVDLAGVPTAVLTGGDGPPLVLLHGQGEFAATWMRIIPDLVTTHRVVAADLPGHGASGIGDDALDRDRVLAWLDELIARTCQTPPVLVGHLLGGAVAARFAVRHSPRIDSLVLVDTCGLRWYRPTAGFGLAMLGFMARPTDRSRDRLFQQCFVDLDGIREEMDGDMELLEAYALDCARRPRLKAALRALMPRFGMPPIAPEDLARITVPTTLIWGRHDLQTPVRTAEAAAFRHGWPLHVIDDAADDPAHEQPGAFLDVFRVALADSPRPIDHRSTS
jgi:pimeloyl-ACP methyl ester carboxylesterase